MPQYVKHKRHKSTVEHQINFKILKKKVDRNICRSRIDGDYRTLKRDNSVHKPIRTNPLTACIGVNKRLLTEIDNDSNVGGKTLK
jgi:hypothetical protein